MNKAISTDFPFELRGIRVQDAQMAYVDVRNRQCKSVWAYRNPCVRGIWNGDCA